MKEIIKNTWLYSIARRIYYFLTPDYHYPNPVGSELKQLKRVLYSTNWNSSYSTSGLHYKLEKEFADFIGCNYAVAVNTGGMALQMIFRGLGLKPGDEVVHQVDTCVATSYAILNSFCTPTFADVDMNSFMLNKDELLGNITDRTKIILPVHMWGNAENMSTIADIAAKKNLLIVEDACLSLGAECENKKIGSFGKAAAFSFGCLKPIQAGEGGMIVTNDSNLAKELRILRDWGETTKELGYRDQKHLSWNGRMSEFVASVALEQLKGYPDHLKLLRENVDFFSQYINSIPGLSIIHTANKSVYTQVVIKINPKLFPISKNEFIEKLKTDKVNVWHANFEPINSLSFFSKQEWRNWVLKGDLDYITSNYSKSFSNAYELYQNVGMGINKIHFLHKRNVKALIKIINGILNLQKQ